ncbi:MAG TPA: DeoR/GlpR family DNA-binding transcription regulator [Jatrophihabitans sp.]|nr:DeoR/GlpR family DNA-binding transcription regulator [Jatrophihabitans sp.]
MKRHARLNALLDAMAATGQVDVDEIAGQLNVSASTIRRDLNHLTEQQLVTRTRGGAVAAAVSYDLPMRYKAPKQQAAKVRIGQAAAKLVGSNDIVALNGGTTTTEVARTLAGRPATAGGGGGITIVTNAINIAGELTLRRHLRLVMTGGAVKPQSFELIGPFAMETLNQLDLDVTIIGAEAIDPAVGVKAMDTDEAQISRLMTARARRVVVAADSTKLHARGFARVCTWDRVSVLVTDTEAGSADLNQIREAGVDVITV